MKKPVEAWVKLADLNVGDLEKFPFDTAVTFTEALDRVWQGQPNEADRAPRGDTVRVRRVLGEIEEVPLRYWHQQQLDRHVHLAYLNHDVARVQREIFRYRVIVEQRLSLYDEITIFVGPAPRKPAY